MTPLAARARAHLQALADPERASAMAAYLKTDMPMWGVPAPQRRRICRELLAERPIESPAEYCAIVEELWSLPYREEKYLAIDVARSRPRFIVRDRIPLYQRLIVEGGWWDLVDDIAIHLVGQVVYDEPEPMRPTLVAWAQHPDPWLRRSAVICQNRHKDHTDADLLFDLCLRCAPDEDPFVRKAIGWALREHSLTDPEAVRHFLARHRHELSPRSYREASKHLVA